MSRVQSSATKTSPKSAPPATTTTAEKQQAVAVDPATAAVAKKKAKKPLKRIFHPMLEAKSLPHPKTGKVREIATKKLDGIPEDYNPKLHKGLMRTDFNDESMWFELTARKFDAKAAELRRQGEDLKSLGGIKDRADAKKLMSLMKRMDELRSKLKSRNVDTSRLDAKIAADLEAAKAAKTEEVKTPAAA